MRSVTGGGDLSAFAFAHSIFIPHFCAVKALKPQLDFDRVAESDGVLIFGVGVNVRDYDPAFPFRRRRSQLIS